MELNGVLNVYKEKGYTSHDVVAKLRGILRQKKIGHAGTLDPEAEGVLAVCLGSATKVCDVLTDTDKVYDAVLLLGRETDTQDNTGTVVREQDVSLSEEEIRKCAASWIGPCMQIPPMYSALKQNGKKLYELAREGKTVERPPRPIRIYDIQITQICLPRVAMTVSCSKGTYIRTLCHDIGKALGCGGCMEALVRRRVGAFSINEAKTLGQIEKMKADGSIGEAVISVPDLFSDYPRVSIKEEYAFLAYNGNPVAEKHLVGCPQDKKTPLLLFDAHGAFIGIFSWRKEKGRYVSEKMFYSGQN